MSPIVGSTLMGNSSGFPIRRDIVLARVPAGRAPVNSPADLLPGPVVKVPSVTDVHMYT